MLEIRSTGSATDETSYYAALENLLNAIGKTLKPAVVCNGQLRNQGSGHPDFGLYTKSQFSKGAPKKGMGAIPERGVIEVKPLSDDTWRTANSDQATKYFGLYRLILLSNYRDFRLIGEDSSGNPQEREFYSFATDESTFWLMCADPVKAASDHVDAFTEFARRVLMSAAPLTRPGDIAGFLASYAREALKTVEKKDDLALKPLREGLETILGIKFHGKKGDHFFKSTLVQTLFYGVFSAWVLVSREGKSAFDWKTAGYVLTVPMIRSIFAEVANPVRLSTLGISAILDRTGEALNRVKRKEFFASFDSGQAVQHFYEPFLKDFDPELRKELGVWYTPAEIVKYMVQRVDHLLRTELNLERGLADKNVYVLDPCCGTGAYVVEVLRRIAATLTDEGSDALIGEDLKEAARERVFGFEILPASFVVAHWQVGNLLASFGAPLDPEEGERPSIYLTNALTGWDVPTGPKATLAMFPELEVERDAAEHVKRDVPVLVILGNPPYNAYAGTSPDEEQGLVEPYKAGLNSKWGIKKFNLDELYVRFFRIAERRIAQTGRGIFSYISSYSYLGDPSYVVLRERLLKQFDAIWIDSLNGDSRETGKLTPTGEPDPSVFSTEFNREGIKLGTSIGLFVLRQDRVEKPIVRFREFWGASKREAVLDSLKVPAFDEQYAMTSPTAINRFTFKPQNVTASYLSWPRVIDLCEAEPISGLQEMRRGTLMSIDRVTLEKRMATYLDSAVSWQALVAAQIGPVKDGGRFDAQKVRAALLKTAPYSASAVRRYALYPLDHRWCYWSAARPLWNEPRPALVNNLPMATKALVTRMSAERPNEGIAAMITAALPDYHLLRPNVVAIPFRLAPNTDGNVGGLLLEMEKGKSRANLSVRARKYIAELTIGDPDSDSSVTDLIWMHATAILSAPEYFAENRDGVLNDWPRVPLPSDQTSLLRSAKLGARIAALLDPDQGFDNASLESMAPLLAELGNVSRVGGGQLAAKDLYLDVGWGGMTEGTVMPGKGRLAQRAWEELPNFKLLLQNVPGMHSALERFGPPVDVFLNDHVYWGNVPTAVWEFRIGGYQVVKKWLSYREGGVLGRPLTKAEARYVSSMIRRLASIVLLNEQLDENYRGCRDSSLAWHS